MRLLSWNLFHGRAVPDRPRPLLHEFASALAGWSWDVALLQEVPPWWPPLLARACGAEEHSVLTSRHELLPVRRAVASRRPDLAKSNGGGANAILVRPPLSVLAHGRRRLRMWPERRVLHAVLVGVHRAPGAGGPAAGGTSESTGALWIGNVHAEPPQDGPGGPGADVPVALERLTAWAGTSGGRASIGGAPRAGAPGLVLGGALPAGTPGLVLGGDLNLRPAAVDALLSGGWSRIASRDVDHVLVRGAVAGGPAEVLGHFGLSDHPPLTVDVRPA